MASGLKHAVMWSSAALLLSVACGGDGGVSPVAPSGGPTLQLQSLLSGVSASNIPAAERPGQPPSSASGPRITVSGNSAVVNGGTLSASVVSTGPFQTMFVYVGSRTAGLATEAVGGVDGFYELRLPSPRTDANVVLAFPQTIPLNELDLLFAVADPSGVVGPYTGLTTRVTSVGTGDVQVTLSWNTDADVDLHVVDPSGEEIYYGHRRSASGGELDLDSNAGCAIDGVRNENITWPVGRAPRGRYTVRVDYWSNCGASRTEYTVRVNSSGQVQIFDGTFTGSGDQGGAGSGRLITVFERSSGPTFAPFTGAPGLVGPGKTFAPSRQ